jgi:DnaK suppressor protein
MAPAKHMKEASAAGLTPAQLSKLRGRLLTERARLRAAADAALAPVRAPRDEVGDAMDEAEQSLEQHEAQGLSAHDRDRLAQVDRALGKLEANTYGVSELSGEPLGYARLDAVPWARFTAVEEEDIERLAGRSPGSS